MVDVVLFHHSREEVGPRAAGEDCHIFTAMGFAVERNKGLLLVVRRRGVRWCRTRFILFDGTGPVGIAKRGKRLAILAELWLSVRLDDGFQDGVAAFRI